MAAILAVVGLVATITGATIPVDAAVPGTPRPAWDQVSSWGINTTVFDAGGIAQVRGSNRDMVIIGRNNTHNGQEWTRDEIEAGKLSKWLLAYMSVGEAQRSEWYWQPEFDTNPPAWIVGQNPWFTNNVYAEVWNGDWQSMLHGTIDRIVDQGFDGAFLDVVDAYWFPGFPGGPAWYNKLHAALTVCALAEHARSHNPEFKLVINNALDLFWTIPGYMDCIDGTVIEGLWWIGSDTERDDFYRNQKIGELEYHKAAGKPIFSLDYAPWWDGPVVEAAAQANGYLPYVTGYTNGALSS
ncbi:MAG: endo alpha-1,4 polygalactosaminidase [Acidimicrobiales bacterium]